MATLNVKVSTKFNHAMFGHDLLYSSKSLQLEKNRHNSREFIL